MRLDVRLAASHKQLIEQAARLMGQTVSTFTVSTLIREASEVVDCFGALRLSEKDSDLFLSALDNPGKPNASLRKAARNHAKQVVS